MPLSSHVSPPSSDVRPLSAILLVDDDPRNVFALSAVLKAKGYTVIPASSSVEAFGVLDTNNTVGIVLLDMMMPGMDGYEAIPKIKAEARFATLPVVAVTAQAMAGDREKCLAAGADDYLAKPVDVDALLTLLNRYLKQ